MAEEMRAVLVDDLDGSEADEIFSFEFDGHWYEIDLTTEHAEQLEGAFQILDMFVDHLRRVGSTGRKARRSAAGTKPRSASKQVRAENNGGNDTKAIRAWAWANGIELSTRGRIPESIVEKWRASLSS